MKKPRSEKEVEKVKGNILKKALAIITDEGFSSLTMRKLATSAGMTAPNLYNYFSNKDEIYLTLVITGFEKLQKSLKTAEQGSSDPMMRAKALMDAYVRFGIQNSAYYDIMFTRSLPKYNDYVGTPHENLSRIEYTISMEIAGLALKAVLDVRAGMDEQAGDDGVKDVVKVWCMLHGMVSLHNSHIIGYVADDAGALYNRIIEELIDTFRR